MNEENKQGYHLKVIPKGTLGNISKISEEYAEFMDASQQNNNLMAMLELSDLLGAIEAYVKNWNMSLEDLIIMNDATKRAFRSGQRKSLTS